MTTAQDAAIRSLYHRDRPDLAFCVGGLRRLAVDGSDRRARKMLLCRGYRYFSRNQAFVYFCLDRLDVALFLDIGTNYGECLVAQPLYCAVPSRGFEPNPRLLPHLRRTLALNDDLTRVSIHHRAVAERAGETVTLHIDRRWSGKSSLVAPEGRGDVEPVAVTTTSVDAETAGLTLDGILLIKLDVEGFEPGVIRGAAETIERCGDIICLMEFDSHFIARGGVDPAGFLDALLERFEVRALGPKGLTSVRGFDDIPGASADGRRHTDLVLTRFATAAHRRAFEDRIVTPGLSRLKRDLFETPEAR